MRAGQRPWPNVSRRPAHNKRNRGRTDFPVVPVLVRAEHFVGLHCFLPPAHQHIGVVLAEILGRIEPEIGSVIPSPSARKVRRMGGSRSERIHTTVLPGTTRAVCSLACRPEARSPSLVYLLRQPGHERGGSGAWEKKRNALRPRISWTFTVAAARRKLRELHPSIED
jgi:hypothetical protein